MVDTFQRKREVKENPCSDSQKFMSRCGILHVQKLLIFVGCKFVNTVYKASGRVS